MLAQEGLEVGIGDVEAWAALSPVRGQVVEIPMPGITPIYKDLDSWTAFAVIRVSNRIDGSTILEAKLLGTEDPMVMEDFPKYFHEESVHIHLCLSDPCLTAHDDPQNYVHTPRLRIWSERAFFADTTYVRPEKAKEMKEWLKPTRSTPAKAAGPKLKPGAKSEPKARKSRKGDEDKPTGKKAPGGEKPKTTRPRKPKVSGEAGKEEEARKREELRDKLRRERERLQRKEPEKEVGALGLPSEEEIVSSSGPGNSPEGSFFVEDEEEPKKPGLNTGVALGSGAMILKSKERTRKEGKDRSKTETLALEDYKNSGKASYSKQLLQQALVTAEVDKKKKKKRKKKDKTGIQQLTSALTKVLTQGSKKKEKKKRKKVIQKDGAILSFSASSEESSGEETQPESSLEEVEAPLRKRARDHPGAVLSMLVKHAKDQMDQSALVDTSESTGLTTGVKIQSYFNLFIKNQYPGYLRELRELHHLSNALDLLRAGSVAQLGDMLSGRFMAIHQSMVDGGWATARHLEINPYEEVTAASAGTILATRKHARVVDKVQGLPGSGYGGAGRGKGGKGQQTWNDPRNEGKGDMKGKKGKKGKGRASWWYPSEKGKDWEKNKEKAEERGKKD